MIRNATTSAAEKTMIRVWDLPVRLFHWLLAGTILVAFVSSEEESPLAPWHVPAGWIVAVLIVFRLVWGFVGGEHARFADFLRPAQLRHHLGGLLAGKPARSVGHNALGGVAILALLGTVGGVVYTGITVQGEGEGLHEGLANLLIGLIVLHVVAVVAMSLLTRENLTRALVTGRKRADLHPGVGDAQPPLTIALPLATIAIGAAAYGATVIDRTAFIPGAHMGAGGDHEAGEDDND